MYRYSKKEYNEKLLKIGEIRIGTLHDFRNKEHKIGISDNQEGKKQFYCQLKIKVINQMMI